MKAKHLRQIRVPDKLYKSIKHHCIAKNQTMIEFCDNMLDWYFYNNPFIQFASYKKGTILSFWLSEQKVEQIKQLAEQAHASEARIVFTALLLYAKEIEIFDHEALL